MVDLGHFDVGMALRRARRTDVIGEKFR